MTLLADLRVQVFQVFPMMAQPNRILERETEELTPVEEKKLRHRLSILRSHSRTPRRSPSLQRQPSGCEPLVIASGSGTQDNAYDYPDDVDAPHYQQQSSSSYPNNMDHKHHQRGNKLSHKHSTTSTFETYSTAPSAAVASSSRGKVTNPFEDPANVESSSSTPSTVASSSSSPLPHPLYRTNSTSKTLHLHSNHGLDGTVSANAGFTAGTTHHHGLPVPVTHKRVHTGTTIGSRRSGRSTSSKLSRRVRKLPRSAKRAIRRLLRRVTGRRQRKDKTAATWTAPQV